mmetsp:Transcript_11696/g.19043  ORF Transcript_11696/g.19043 Transcript_11696/m.19043 type:complete len:286 (+) Transcript_11696:220-1077(+)
MKSPFREDAIKGRVVLITGGGSGIGFGIAKSLGTHGAKVVIMGRRENFLKDACSKLEGNGVQCAYFSGDVRKEQDADDAVKTAVERFGRLDTLINSAAGNFLALSEEMSMNAFRTVMEIDAFGVFNLCRAAFPALKAANNGVVINISATLQKTASWYQTHACAAKSAIDSMTRNLALEWGIYGIRVNGIAPGPIKDTPGLAKLQANPAHLSKVVEQIPLQRIGTTDDIGLTALFLCTDAGSYISGDTIIVDGGEWLWKEPQVPRGMVSKVSRQVEDKSRSLKASL